MSTLPKLETVTLGKDDETETDEILDPAALAARHAADTARHAKEITTLTSFVKNMPHLKQLIVEDFYDLHLSDYDVMIKSSNTLLTIGMNSDEINLPLSTLLYLTKHRDAFDKIEDLHLDWRAEDTIETFGSIDWTKLRQVKELTLSRSMLSKLVEHPDLITLLPEHIKIVNLDSYNTLTTTTSSFTEDEVSALITHLPHLSQIVTYQKHLTMFTGGLATTISAFNRPSEALQKLINEKKISFLAESDLYYWSPLNSEIEDLTLTPDLLEYFSLDTIITTCPKLENITISKALSTSLPIKTIKLLMDECKTLGFISFQGMPSYDLGLLEAHKNHALAPRIEIELESDSESDDDN